MADPKAIYEIGDWKLTRFDYDGAPLVAERRRRKQPTIEVNFDAVGDLSVDIEGQDGICIPAPVLERLLADRDARQAKAGM